MGGCLEIVRIPDMEWLQRHRNLITSVVSGVLFFTGWWLAIDAAVCYTDKNELRDVFHICGVFATISMFMVNGVSSATLENPDAYTDGCLGVRGARIWFFFGCLMGFGSLIGASYILFGEYIALSNKSTEGEEDGVNTFNPTHTYPGVAIFLQNLFIFMASLIFKFGRSEESYGY